LVIWTSPQELVREFCIDNGRASSWRTTKVDGEVRTIIWRNEDINDWWEKFRVQFPGTISRSMFFTLIPPEVRIIKGRECCCEVCLRYQQLKGEIESIRLSCHQNCAYHCAGKQQSCDAADSNRQQLRKLCKELASIEQNHKGLVLAQAQSYQISKTELTEDDVLIVMDFSFLIKGDRLFQTQNGWFS
jgi:hypothetical protein